MKFTAKIYLIEFDKRGYLDKLDEKMTETVKESGKVWLRTVLGLIPTWSRASRATFEHLAEALGVGVSYGPVLSNKDRLSLGLQTGKGGLKIAKNRSYYFWYETDLRYLAFNEFNEAVAGDVSGWFSTHRGGPGPYRFQAAGAAEFLSFAQNVKLPNPLEYIKPQRLK